MKIESYHKAYDLLTQCARESDAMDHPEIRNLIEESRAKLKNAWDRLQEIESGSPEQTDSNDWVHQF